VHTKHLQQQPNKNMENKDQLTQTSYSIFMQKKPTSSIDSSDYEIIFRFAQLFALFE
jgi:hypothetical protein